MYFSVCPPFPAFGVYLTFSSLSLPLSSPSFFSFFGLFLASYCFLNSSCNSNFLASSSSISSIVAPEDSVMTCFGKLLAVYAFISACFAAMTSYLYLSSLKRAICFSIMLFTVSSDFSS
jgi:hypothetical protein